MVATGGLARTDRASWKKEGWQQFQWGMGPADVRDALRSGGGKIRSEEFRSEPVPGAGTSYQAGRLDGFTLRGTPIEAAFVFLDGRLGLVSLSPAFEEGTPTAPKMQWMADVAGLLVEKYGQPLERKGYQRGVPLDIAQQPRVSWQRGEQTIQLYAVGNAASAVVVLAYAHGPSLEALNKPRAADPRASKGPERDLDKL
jgi:hypothetical protein